MNWRFNENDIAFDIVGIDEIERVHRELAYTCAELGRIDSGTAFEPISPAASIVSRMSKIFLSIFADVTHAGVLAFSFACGAHARHAVAQRVGTIGGVCVDSCCSSRNRELWLRLLLNFDKPEPKTLMLGRFVIDTAKHQVTKEGISIKLTPKEFKILLALARMPDTVLSKEQLIEDAWGAEFVGETQSITVFIKKLRNKIEDDPSDPRIIETVWGIGYRLVESAC